MSYPVYSGATRDSELPIYSNHDPIVRQVQHVYHLRKDDHRYLTVSVNSSAERTEQIPRMHQGQTISGVVQLNLREDSLIRSVTVTVTGHLKCAPNPGKFLSMRSELYSVEARDNSLHSSGNHANGRSKLTKGAHRWPFVLKLPKGVGIPFGGPEGVVSKYILPASLTDAASKTSIEYELLVRIKKGTLSAGHRLSVPFQYVPLVRPEPPSVLRQMSCLENIPLMGPLDDPEGWTSLPLIIMEGDIFNIRTVRVSYMVWLASPTRYTRGTPLQMWLEIVCTDNQALDILSSPSAQDIQLIRSTSYCQITSMMGLLGGNAGPKASYSKGVAQAEFWLVKEEPGRRVLQGEIIVPADIPPNCHILNFTLEYLIAIYPLKAAGFTVAPRSKQPLLTENINIATLPAAGPPAKPHSPPTYTPASA